MRTICRSVYFVIPILVLASAAISIEVNAQTRWVTFSPPGKGFSIKVPRKPTYKHRSLNYDEQGLFEGNTHADIYDFSPNDSGTIGAISVFHLTRPKSGRQFNKESDSIMEVIGGDDKKFLKRISVTINGLHAREYVYRKGDIRGRVLIVNARKKVFFVQYHTEAGVLPRFVDRIFGSFRVLPRKLLR